MPGALKIITDGVKIDFSMENISISHIEFKKF